MSDKKKENERKFKKKIDDFRKDHSWTSDYTILCAFKSPTRSRVRLRTFLPQRPRPLILVFYCSCLGLFWDRSPTDSHRNLPALLLGHTTKVHPFYLMK